ncbi:UDP-N-acetyl-D-galactosamine dehydrogenase [Anaerocolumna cellulosilytica]|uniref:UDP-N-acetyl-D-galactosamine dehydrogenase n=1 Tax=Anaerocolumna cellulosilytica TaxID=433286 RepID=A0A6S6R506_9FIRM|nr:nucleotide sugar dehydrogenase [Anaerocolumna cellulosilytica]MBB5194288.1 UDP-N-acetyl-D-galactosamine dehydrogenase [Anaerocolumna cellulosilytica]BCJ94500.1 UDP-N-acetyl-D-galactosamine dehydrogenase [Anaerocolumna cellulosilytica]
MNFIQRIQDRKEKITVIGLGYVGLPLAVAFAKKAEVIGFDINQDKVSKLKLGVDPTQELGDEVIQETTVEFTDDISRIGEGKFLVIVVPTPVNADKTPDLEPVITASKMVGKELKKGSIVVYESTVYPGVTEDICIPVLEKESGLICGVDFKVGYSPERINPGDKVHKLENIRKIVSGMDSESLDIIAGIYEMIVEAGVHKVSSIKVAEAAKVAENSQRDINIAFVNELAMVFDRMEIDTREVIEAMNSKWNALGFYPGLVGGHCIGVDPYYFIYEAQKLGYHSQIILSGRKINDGMAEFVADTIIKQLILADKNVKRAKVAILGITFKENCSDVRNSKVEDIVNFLKVYGIQPVIVDPVAEPDTIERIYGIRPLEIAEVSDMDCVVFTVGHDAFKGITLKNVEHMFDSCEGQEKVLIDVKGIFDRYEAVNAGFRYWRL